MFPERVRRSCRSPRRSLRRAAADRVQLDRADAIAARPQLARRRLLRRSHRATVPTAVWHWRVSSPRSTTAPTRCSPTGSAASSLDELFRVRRCGSGSMSRATSTTTATSSSGASTPTPTCVLNEGDGPARPRPRSRRRRSGAARASDARALTMSITTDMLYPPYQQHLVRDVLQSHGIRADDIEIDSPHGHDGFLIEVQQVGAALERDSSRAVGGSECLTERPRARPDPSDAPLISRDGARSGPGRRCQRLGARTRPVGDDDVRDADRRRGPAHGDDVRCAAVLQPLRQPDRRRSSRRRSPSSRAPRPARAFASGMGAISAVVLGLCSTGDHIVTQRQLYAGTQLLFQTVCPRFGIDVTFVDATEPGRVRRGRPPGQDRCSCFAETPANPRSTWSTSTELGAIAGPDHRGRLDVRDAAGPAPARPRRRPGACTRRRRRSPDTTTRPSGVVVGQRELIDWIWGFAVLHGANASPFDALNGLRGIRTLPVRIERQTATAHRVAEFLEAHPKVGRSSGIRAWTVAPAVRARRATDARLPAVSSPSTSSAASRQAGPSSSPSRSPSSPPSLGGPETLVTHPASTTHVSLTPDELDGSGHRARHHPGLDRSRASRRPDRRLRTGAPEARLTAGPSGGDLPIAGPFDHRCYDQLPGAGGSAVT